MGPAADRISLIHFNDVYNVEPRTQKPGIEIEFKTYKDFAFWTWTSGSIFSCIGVEFAESCPVFSLTGNVTSFNSLS